MSHPDKDLYWAVKLDECLQAERKRHKWINKANTRWLKGLLSWEIYDSLMRTVFYRTLKESRG